MIRRFYKDVTLTKAAGVPTTPAMAAGVEDRVWTVADIAALVP